MESNSPTTVLTTSPVTEIPHAYYYPPNPKYESVPLGAHQVGGESDFLRIASQTSEQGTYANNLVLR